MKRSILVLSLLVLVAGVATAVAFATRGHSGESRASAVASVAKLERDWRSHLRQGVRLDPGRRFPSPPRRWLAARLLDAATLCGCFTVREIEMLHPHLAAPFVVVEATDERKMLAVQVAFFDLVDRYPARGPDGHQNWAYEGFFFEARNSHGIPFFAADNFLRDMSGSSSWATPGLLPATLGGG